MNDPIYDVRGQRPPAPPVYPATITYRLWRGEPQLQTFRNAAEFHAFVFWYWETRPLGQSKLSPVDREPDGGLRVVGEASQ